MQIEMEKFKNKLPSNLIIMEIQESMICMKIITKIMHNLRYQIHPLWLKDLFHYQAKIIIQFNPNIIKL